MAAWSRAIDRRADFHTIRGTERESEILARIRRGIDAGENDVTIAERPEPRGTAALPRTCVYRTKVYASFVVIIRS